LMVQVISGTMAVLIYLYNEKKCNIQGADE
jgi:hypothetical protein